MGGKIIIDMDEKHNVSIHSDLHGQELYEAYVALTAQLATELRLKNDIEQISAMAVQDALRMLEDDDAGYWGN